MGKDYTSGIKSQKRQLEHIQLPLDIKDTLDRVGYKEFARCVGMDPRNLHKMIKRGWVSKGIYPKFDLALRLCAESQDSHARFIQFRKNHPRVAAKLLKAIAYIKEQPVPEVYGTQYYTPLMGLWRNYLDARNKLFAEYERILLNDKNFKI